jgi:hypothetical protein
MTTIEPAKLIAPMLERFMAADRGNRVGEREGPISTASPDAPFQ